MGRSVVIVDYGLGNLFSVEMALHKVGALDAVISNEKSVVEDAQRLILPGVGAFGDGMENLRAWDLVDAIKAYAASGKPVLGVCLGMQLLMSESEEFGLHPGLDLVPGRVVRLRPQEDSKLKVPLIGWNSLHCPEKQMNGNDPWSGTVMRGIDEGSFAYFLHSYVVVPNDPDVSLAVSPYGRDWFCSALKQGNITGVQFHPERSGEEGLHIYHNFIADA